MAKYGMDLTEGSVSKKLLSFIVPIFLAGIMQQFYNTADIAIVGRFVGDDALAAVGSTTALVNVILSIFFGLSVGANVVCARNFGARDRKGLHNTIHSSMLLGLICGIFLGVFGIVFARPLLLAMGTPQEILPAAVLYIRIYFIGGPASLLYNFGSGILRAGGDTKRPLYILFLSGIVNVALNLFCVLVLDLGVAGVAIGTIASQIVAATLVITILIRSETEIHMEISKIRFHKKELLQVIRIGLPAGFNSIMFNLGNVILQSTVNSFGKVAIAGTTAANNVEIYCFWIITAVEQGVVSFVGQCVGAKKFHRIDKVYRSAILVAEIGTIFLCILMYFNMPFVLKLFTDGDDVIRAGIVKLSFVCLWYWSYQFSPISSGCMRGMGYSTLPTVINAITICLVRVLWLLVVFPFNPTFNMVFWCFPLSWCLSSLSQMVAFYFVRKRVYGEKKAET